MIDPDFLAHLKATLTCQDVATHYNVRIRRAQGPHWQAHCFNTLAHAHGDRNPSLSLGLSHFQCFAAQCDIHGDVLDLVASLEGLDTTADFDTVVQIAADLAGLSLVTAATPKKPLSPPRLRQTPRVPLAPKSPFDGFFPPKDHAPLDLAAFAPRQQVMRQVWECVAAAPLPGEACAWLEGRGIRPEVAWALGGRDWSSASQALGDCLGALDQAALEAAGFGRRLETWSPWTGLQSLHPGQGWARGICLPVVHPDWQHAPLAWRLRLYTPYTTASGHTLKALAQHAGSPPLPSLPLGLGSLPLDPGPAPIFVLCEGEPDWLSLADALDTLAATLPRPVHPIALVAMSSGYPFDFVPLLERAHRIVCMFDEGPVRGGMSGGMRAVEKLRGGLMHAFKTKAQDASFDAVYDAVNQKLVVALQPDAQDLNDLHRQGALVPLLHDLLEVIG